ncbi:MAG: hypothetical protein ACR2LQ_13680 [Acidimicrobiales bacterium]
MAKTDPDAIVAEASAKLPVSASGGILIVLLCGLGALSIATGLATAQWGGLLSGVLALGLGLLILRGERKGVVRHIVVRGNGKVELEAGAQHRTMYSGDIVRIQAARQRGRLQLELRDGSKLRVATPLDGFDGVVAALKARHRGLEVKL